MSNKLKVSKCEAFKKKNVSFSCAKHAAPTPKSKKRKLKAWARFHGRELDFAADLKRACVCQCVPRNDDGSCMFGHKVVPIEIIYTL